MILFAVYFGKKSTLGPENNKETDKNKKPYCNPHRILPILITLEIVENDNKLLLYFTRIFGQKKAFYRPKVLSRMHWLISSSREYSLLQFSISVVT